MGENLVFFLVILVTMVVIFIKVFKDYMYNDVDDETILLFLNWKNNTVDNRSTIFFDLLNNSVDNRNSPFSDFSEEENSVNETTKIDSENGSITLEIKVEDDEGEVD